MSDTKVWKLQKMDEDSDEDLKFDDLQKGDVVMAYWSPNRAYYPATLVKTTEEGARPEYVLSSTRHVYAY